MDDTSAEVGLTARDVVVDRRRPGRIKDANPALIALMRRPSAEARRAVQLFDAPNFQPSGATQTDRRRLRQQRRRLVGATCVCAGACAAAFETMLWVWN